MAEKNSSLQQYSDWYDNLRKVSLKNPLTTSHLDNKIRSSCSQREELLEFSSLNLLNNNEKDSDTSDDDKESSSGIKSDCNNF